MVRKRSLEGILENYWINYEIEFDLCTNILLTVNHHIVLVARISLTLSRHSSLSFIALGRSSGQHPVSSHSCWMYVRAGRPAFARPCVGIHKSTSLMSSSLLLQQCPTCLVRLTWIVFVIGGRWPYSWCLVGCCCQDLFRIARSIFVKNGLCVKMIKGRCTRRNNKLIIIIIKKPHITTLYFLFNAEIWFICWASFFFLAAYRLFMGHSMSKFG